MKKDIDFKPVNGIKVAVIQEDAEDQLWRVYLLNETDLYLHNLIVVTKGYGVDKEGEKQQTSTLRHYIDELAPHSYALVEPIDKAVLHLFNEYWVSYYVDRKIHDKKYNFVPGSITDDNLTEIPLVGKMGILHE